MISISIFGTQVKAKKMILFIIVAAVWASVTLVQFHWHPERGFWQGLLIGLVTTLFY